MKAQFLNIVVKLLLIISVTISISNGNIVTSTNEVKLSIADNRYNYDHCCWAAVCQTVLQYYKVNNKSQDDIINWASNGQHVINYTCNHTNPKSIDTILSYFAKIPVQSDSCAGNYVDINKVKTEIDHDRPIIGLWKFWYGPPVNQWANEGIFCIIYGYTPTSPIYQIKLQSPNSDDQNGGYRNFSYDTLTYHLLGYYAPLGCNVYERWSETLALGGSNTNPPSPNPPFNPANQNTISQRVIPAAIHSFFQAMLKRVP